MGDQAILYLPHTSAMHMTLKYPLEDVVMGVCVCVCVCVCVLNPILGKES